MVHLGVFSFPGKWTDELKTGAFFLTVTGGDLDALEVSLITSQDQQDKITQIVAALDKSLLAANAENRRLQPRIAMRTVMSLLLLTAAAPTPVEVFTRNISSSGMGFVGRRMFHAHERIVVTLKIPNISPKIVLAHVVFCRYIGGGFYEMGAEFLECATKVDAGGNCTIPNHWLEGTSRDEVLGNCVSAAIKPSADSTNTMS